MTGLGFKTPSRQLHVLLTVLLSEWEEMHPSSESCFYLTILYTSRLKSAPSMKPVFWVLLPCGTSFTPLLGFCQTMVNGGTWVRPTHARTSAPALEGGCHLISIAASPSPRRASTNVHRLKQWWTLRWWLLSEAILGTRARSTLSWVLGG